MKCGLLPMPPAVWWSVTWWYHYAWAIHLCIPLAGPRKHLLHPPWPSWPWEQVWHLWCSQKNRSVSLSCSSGSGHAQGCRQVPPDRTLTWVACVAILFFFVCFLTLIFTFMPLPPPQSHCSWATCSVYSLSHCFQLCCNRTRIWFSWYSYLGNLILVWNCCYGYLGAAGLARLLLKMCGPLQLSVRLSRFSSSPLFATCATQLSLTAVPVTFVSFSHGFLSRPSIYHAMLCSLPCPCQLAEPLLE